MQKLIFIFLILFFSALISEEIYAQENQKKNSIAVYSGTFHNFHGRYWRQSMFGIKYERAISKNQLWLGAGFEFWNPEMKYHYKFEGLNENKVLTDTSVLRRRFTYKFFDLMLSKRISLSKNFSIAASAGLSVANGHAEIEMYKKNYNNYFNTDYEDKKVTNPGLKVSASASYAFWKKRLSLGLSIDEKIYWGFRFPIFDAYAHLGINF